MFVPVVLRLLPWVLLPFVLRANPAGQFSLFQLFFPRLSAVNPRLKIDYRDVQRAQVAFEVKDGRPAGLNHLPVSGQVDWIKLFQIGSNCANWINLVQM